MSLGSSDRNQRFAGPAILLLAAGMASATLVWRGNSCGHDFDFHLVSWFDCLSSWQHGILYPHWAPSANYGAGEPRFIFYPPLTWMLGAALGLILKWQFVGKVLTFLLLAATGFATRSLARQALSDGAATLAGCAALFCGYALFSAYERSAFGELSGGFWIPFLLLLILRETNSSAPFLRRVLDGSTLALALVVAGSWLSNAPVGVMACYLLAAVALVSAILKKSLIPIVRAAVAAALGLGLAAIYLVPAAVEQRWVDIRQATSDPGEMIENSWLFGRHASPALQQHDMELMRVSLIAVSMLAVAVVGLLVAWLRGNFTRANDASATDRARMRAWWIPLALIPFAILFLQFRTSLPVWNLLPKLRFLQFPWRWLVVLQAPMAIFFAAAVWPRASAPRWRCVSVAGACALVFVGVSFVGENAFFQECDEEDNVFAMVDVYRTGAGFAGTDEYAPLAADNSLVATGLPLGCLVNDPTVELGSGPENTVPAWYPEQKTCDATFAAAADPGEPASEHLRVSASVPHAGYIVLRLRAYPAWRVTVNGQPVATLPHRDDGLMAVPVAAGPLNLAVDWTTTGDVSLGRWITLVSLLLLVVLFVVQRRVNRPRLS
jgi:hypothetical protein